MQPSVQQPISKDKSVIARTRKYYFKNHYLTLRSKVKVQQRSLWYVTHCLMVMHPHTKYHRPISKEKNVMAWTRKYYLKNNYLTLRSKVKVITVCDTPPYCHALTYQISLTSLERNNYLTLRSTVKVQRRSLQYATHRLMVMHPHTKYH